MARYRINPDLKRIHLSDLLKLCPVLTNMQTDHSTALPEAHRAFIDNAIRVLPDDARILGLAAAGSYRTGTMDQFSDPDLIVITVPDRQAEALSDRHAIAHRLGAYLAGFTGEHIGDPRVLITLYGPPLLHVDLKFVALTDAHVRVEEPAVIWQRDDRFPPHLRKAAEFIRSLISAGLMIGSGSGCIIAPGKWPRRTV